MAKKCIISNATLIPFLAILINLANADYNVYKFGAIADGVTDSTQAFLDTWTAACSTTAATGTITIPKGRYLIKPITFRGPCKNPIVINNAGTIVAPSDYKQLGDSGYWILFIKVDRVSLYGGVLDARGAGYWACKNSGKTCPAAARSITFNWASDIVISGLVSVNSQATHLVINSCENVVVRNVKFYAPSDSPNTDGIHVQTSTGVSISSCTLQTGDDCISIGPGTRNLYMTKISCGPGHGVSIGSLGKSLIEEGVENITLTNSVFVGSDNGVRIKSWANPSNGFVKNVLFKNIVMKNPKNPIIIDQNYCPGNEGCSNTSSGVKISDVIYSNIQGTSAREEGIIFDCSSSNPCTGIILEDVMLTYSNQPAVSSCANIVGTTNGVIMPNNCLN